VITPAALKELDPKLRLIERTRDSIAGEMRSIQEDADYAHACVAWLPAKVYYNLYHILSIIEYMVSGDKRHLRIPHHTCLQVVASRLGIGTLYFSCPLFNTVCNKNILKFRTRSGEVLSEDISDERLMSLIMKKIASDKLGDYKTRKRLDCRKPGDRKLFAKEKDAINISIVDFFYSMRIRTNYKDMSFIDEVSAEQARTYFIEYFKAADNFCVCLNDLKNDLIAKVSATC
jgi:hypothetical protein